LFELASVWSAAWPAPDSLRQALCQRIVTRFPEKSATALVDLVVELQCTPSQNTNYLLSHTYYYLLQRPPSDWVNDERLTNGDRIRLVCGYYSLTAKWKEIVTQRAEFDLESGAWTLPMAALIERMERPVARVSGDSQRQKRRFTHEQVNTVRDELWDHFNLERWGITC
jgi:hypothetical protein